MASGGGSHSEVFSWLKAISPNMKLERLSPNFETRGFRSRRSLAYVKPDDLDVFFGESPNKLLLAEKRVLEAELNKIKEENNQLQSRHPGSAKQLDFGSNKKSLQQQLSISPGMTNSAATGAAPSSALDKRATEHRENLDILSAQIESTKQHLESKRRSVERYDLPTGRRGKVCSLCHKAGHNRARCKGFPCTDINSCQLKDKHPELQTEIKEIQKELKELEKNYVKAKSDNDVFVASRERAKSNFFAVMRPRLKQQNPAKYIERSALDRDLQILQRALANKIPIDSNFDWRLPAIIEEFKRGLAQTFPPSSNEQGYFQMP